MGMWQSLVRGYEDNVDSLKAQEFYLGSTKKSCSSKDTVVFVLRDDGSLKEIKKYDYEDREVSLLVSEDSESRSSTAVRPHCLFDSADYVCGWGDKSQLKHAEWRDRVCAFCEFSAIPQVKALCRYVDQDTFVLDLKSSKIPVTDKTLILFEVISAKEAEFRLWKIHEIYEAWINFILNKKQSQLAVDCITGLKKPIAESHCKKINNLTGNAKLISSNDDLNFTYRGRFAEASEVVRIGYESAQKAHQFLRYLISTRGIRSGSQAIVTWTTGVSKADASILPPVEDAELDLCNDAWGSDDGLSGVAARSGVVFSDALRDEMLKGRYSELLEKHPRTSVLILDAATDGRMSVVLYRELDTGEYLERIAQWHESAAWQLSYYVKENAGESHGSWHSYIGAPSVDAILTSVYGKPKSGKDEGYAKNKMSVREEMIHVIFDDVVIPADYLSTIFHRLTRPLSFKNKESFDRLYYTRTLAVYCALFKRDLKQRNEEIINMKLEQDRRTRSYLYGRLLGAADKLEEYALGKSGKDKRETAALRYMQLFAQRPFTTWETIHRALVPYVQKVKGSVAHKEMECIHALFSGDDFCDDRALDGFYLLGYYHELDYINDRVADLKQQKMDDND